MQVMRYGAAGVALMALAGVSCIDQKYDLSDIDTTVRVEVNDLVVPVNIDEVTLGSIFNLKEGDRIQEVDGEYAVVEDGTFSSEGISVAAVHMPAPSISATSNDIAISGGGASFSQLPGGILKVDIFTDETGFHAEDASVNSSIVSVTSIGTKFDIEMKLTLGGFEGKLKSFSLKDFRMQLPKGMTMTSTKGTYDAATGLYTAAVLKGEDHTLTIDFKMTSVDTAGGALVYTVEDDSHKLTFDGRMRLESAVLEITEGDLVDGGATVLPATMSLQADYDMSDIDVDTFSGEIHYIIDVSAFTDIDLSDLPDVLTQDGTNIVLTNPQIYLKVNNPMSAFGLYATTGLEITAHRADTDPKVFALDSPGYFKVPGTEGVDDYTFCLSPKAPSKPYGDYSTAVHVPYTSLSDVLSGDGLPGSLSIQMMNPELPVQHVTDFKLGEELGAVEGSYTFFAPLALAGGSTIVYTDTEDGWSSETLDKMVIRTLSVSVDVSSDLPLGVELTGYPIDVEGNQIRNVEIVGAHIPAGAKNLGVTIKTTGEIRRLDGIRFTAEVKSGNPDEALSPDMGLVLKNIRAKVSGYYEDEL